jgi:hypothetical protein
MPSNLLKATLSQQIRKPKLLRSNPHRKSLLINGEDPGRIDDEDIISSYRRNLNPVFELDHDDDLSDDIKWRLFLARQLALLKYKQKWGA